MQRCSYFRPTCTFYLFSIVALCWLGNGIVVQCFRILESEDKLKTITRAIFEPYQHGSAGYFGDPSNPDPERVNEGNPFSPDTPRIFRADTPLQDCPGMVGPLNTSEYYCRGREYGYCDRRSGICECNQGYQGLDCTDCKPSYYKVGSICYPKKNCPNDCSRGGTCDYKTGTCKCFENRIAHDCSQMYCHFDKLCTSCTSTKCLSCIEGFYVSANQTCVSCKTFDPRCLVCDVGGCLQCADPLLNSIRRSGARNIDQPLPFDELTREFSYKFSYGSQKSNVFDEAEVFYLTNTPQNKLKDKSKSCSQGKRLDSSWDCVPFLVSHIVCGHKGTVNFVSPLYAISENAQNISLTIRRTGGGVGNLSVLYEIQHISSSPDDVSPTAFYTSSQVLFFEEGVVELSFFLTIHDDKIYEPNEIFHVFLKTNDGEEEEEAVIGNQGMATITIIDDDRFNLNTMLTRVIDPNLLLKGGIAGNTMTFQIQAINHDKTEMSKGGEMFIIESRTMQQAHTEEISEKDFEEWKPMTHMSQGTVIDHKNGFYTCSWKRNTAGKYQLSVYSLAQGGLRGEYYDDPWFDSPRRINRIDRFINFTWNDGPLFEGAKDHVAIRWTGKLKAKATGLTTFYVTADDHVRLWINETLLIDHWDQQQLPLSLVKNLQCSFYLNANSFYDIMIEYRELVGNAKIQLAWSTASSFSKEIIPMEQLFYMDHIQGSPFLNIPIVPNTQLSEMETFLEGGDFDSIISGFPLQFQIVSMDIFGNPRDAGGFIKATNVEKDFFKVQLALVTDQSNGGIGSRNEETNALYDTTSGKFNVYIKPLISGIYEMNVYLNNTSVKLMGSPFKVKVLPNQMHATRSLVSGTGIQPNRIAGVLTSIFVEARDVNNNRIYTGGMADLLELRAIHKTITTAIELAQAIIDNKDGTYRLDYIPRVVGTYLVSIYLNGVMVNNSPYSVSVVQNIPHRMTTSAIGNGLVTGLTNIQSTFTVITRDQEKNDIKKGNGNTLLTVSLAHTKETITGTCTDNLNGLYTCTYTPKYTGKNLLHVAIASGSGGTINPSAGPILGSPFTVDVLAGPALGSFCIANGNGLVSSITGIDTNFTLSIKDFYNNDKVNAGTESISVVLTSIASSSGSAIGITLNGIVKYLGEGKYFVTYQTKIKGFYEIVIQVNQIAIQGSPFRMYAFPNVADYKTTSIELLSQISIPFIAGENIQMRLITKDLYGNVLETGGERFQFDFGQDLLVPNLIDEKNGSYFMTIKPLKAIKYDPFVVFLLIPGGLNATFYGNPDLTLPSVLFRQDLMIDFDFNVQAPLSMDQMNTFSIQWKGFLLPKYTEVYTFEIHIEGRIQFSIQDQKLIDTWTEEKTTTVSSSSTVLKGSIYLEANVITPMELNFSKPIGGGARAKIQLYWKSFSQQKEKIPSSQLYTRWRIQQNLIPLLDILPAKSTPSSFTIADTDADTDSADNADKAVIERMGHLVVGQVFDFQLIARDSFGNQRRQGKDLLYVLFPQLPKEMDWKIKILDHENGRYTISFTPTLTGIFSMLIASPPSLDFHVGSVDPLYDVLLPFQIKNSPFEIKVIPNEPLASTSTIERGEREGEGFEFAIAGKQTFFLLQARDLYGNRIQHGQDLIEIEIRLQSSSIQVIVQEQEVKDLKDGTYQILYTPQQAGKYDIFLRVNQKENFTSKTSNLIVLPNYPSSLTSSVCNEKSIVQARVPQLYRVDLKDFYNNPQIKGGHDLVVFLNGPVVSLRGNITDLTNGSYFVDYFFPLEGVYEIQTHIANEGHGLVGYYYENTRFFGGSALRQVDALISFDWKKNPLNREYPRIKWKGFLKPKYTEMYTFKLVTHAAGALYMDNQVIIDTINDRTPSDTNTVRDTDPQEEGKIFLIAGRLHEITIEYRSPRDRDQSGYIHLYWKSDRQPLELVPSNALRPEASEILPRIYIKAIN